MCSFLFLCISYVNDLVSLLFRFFFYFLLNGCSVLQLFKSSMLFNLVNIFARLNKLFVSCVVTYIFFLYDFVKNFFFVNKHTIQFPSEVLSSELHCRICYSRRHFKMAANARSREISQQAHLATVREY